MDKKELQLMFDNVVHIGHRTQKWNPRMRKFIYGEKDGIHIINLEKTVEYLTKALDYISKLVSEGRTILFVSTKPQSIKVLREVAQECRMPYVVSKWIPGLLTNFATIRTRTRYLAELKQQEASGEFDKYTKKEALHLKKTIAILQASLGGVESLQDKPDAIFVVDTVRDKIAVKEAKKIKIPVIGIVDTNADPTKIDYPIPGNDDAIKSLNYLIGEIKDVILKSKGAKAKK